LHSAIRSLGLENADISEVMYLGCAPLLTLLTDMVGAPQNELAPFAPERRAEIPVIRGNATICRIGHDCLFSGEIAARGDSDAYATEGTAVHCVVERSATANLFNDLTDFYPPAAATNSPDLARTGANHRRQLLANAAIAASRVGS